MKNCLRREDSWVTTNLPPAQPCLPTPSESCRYKIPLPSESRGCPENLKTPPLETAQGKMPSAGASQNPEEPRRLTPRHADTVLPPKPAPPALVCRSNFAPEPNSESPAPASASSLLSLPLPGLVHVVLKSVSPVQPYSMVHAI